MPTRICRNNNRATNNNLCDTIQSAYRFTVDRISKFMYKERNQSNQHEQSGQSCQPFKCDCDAGSNAYCTCTRTASRATTGSTCGSCTTTANSLIRKHKYTTITTSRECANDLLNREYAEYLASTSAGREDVSTGVRVSDEPRDFKPTDADSGDSIERRIGIPAGVTV